MRHTTSQQRWVLALASLASFMVALDSVVVATALEPIRRDLDASVAELEWTVNAYNLSFGVLLMTAAVLGDRLGRRRVFVAGLVVFAVTSAACALAPSIGALIVARALQGAGAAMVMPLALALLSAAFPVQTRGMALGLFGAVTGIAVAGGPVLGGAVTEGLAWEWIFWLNVPAGAVAVVLALRRVGESHGPLGRLDLGGLALVTAGALGIVWGLVRGNEAGWGSAEVLTSLAAGLVLTAAFAAWERRAPAPMLPSAYFRARGFTAGNVAVFFQYASLLGSLFFIAQFMQVAFAAGPLEGGLRLLSWTATLFFVAPIAGALVGRVGERPLMVLGGLLQAGGMAWIAAVASADPAYGSLVAPLIVAGVGISMQIPATESIVMAALPADALGKAAGAHAMLRQLGGSFGLAVAVAAFGAAGSYATGVTFADGFEAAIAASAALALLGACASAWVPGRRPATVLPAATAEATA